MATRYFKNSDGSEVCSISSGNRSSRKPSAPLGEWIEITQMEAVNLRTGFKYNIKPTKKYPTAAQLACLSPSHKTPGAFGKCPECGLKLRPVGWWIGKQETLDTEEKKE